MGWAQASQVASHVDVVKGVITALQKIDSSGNYLDANALDGMVAALPSLIAVAKCQQEELTIPLTPPRVALDVEVEGTGGEEERRSLLCAIALPADTDIEKFLQAFQAATRESNALCDPHNGVDLSMVKGKISKYIRRNADDITVLLEIQSAKVSKAAEELASLLIDPKPILKHLDTRIGELIDVEHRTRIKELLKLLNGASGSKGMQRIMDALKGTDVNIEHYEEDM